MLFEKFDSYTCGCMICFSTCFVSVCFFLFICLFFGMCDCLLGVCFLMRQSYGTLVKVLHSIHVVFLFAATWSTQNKDVKTLHQVKCCWTHSFDRSLLLCFLRSDCPLKPHVHIKEQWTVCRCTVRILAV